MERRNHPCMTQKREEEPSDWDFSSLQNQSVQPVSGRVKKKNKKKNC